MFMYSYWPINRNKTLLNFRNHKGIIIWLYKTITTSKPRNHFTESIKNPTSNQSTTELPVTLGAENCNLTRLKETGGEKFTI